MIKQKSLCPHASSQSSTFSQTLFYVKAYGFTTAHSTHDESYEPQVDESPLYCSLGVDLSCFLLDVLTQLDEMA